jgi:hypothetical protein
MVVMEEMGAHQELVLQEQELLEAQVQQDQQELQVQAESLMLEDLLDTMMEQLQMLMHEVL